MPALAAAQPSRIDSAESTYTPAPATSSVTPLLTVRDYRVHFPIRQGVLKRTIGYVKAVDGISFTLAAGRTLALVGESGCGKTTTGKALLQLLRDSARIEGEARLDGQPLDRLEGDELHQARRKMQIIFQDPFSSLNPRMRVSEILEEGIVALRPTVDAAQRRVRSGGAAGKGRLARRCGRSLSARVFRRPAATSGDCARAWRSIRG